MVIIIVLAVVLFGPEKLPQYSRKAARVFVYLRDIANNAKNTIGTELGPEYADLELKDLNPKAFLAKQLQNEVALIDEAKRELKDAEQLLKSGSRTSRTRPRWMPPRLVCLPSRRRARSTHRSTLRRPDSEVLQGEGLVAVPGRLLVWVGRQQRLHGRPGPLARAHTLDPHLVDDAEATHRADERCGTVSRRNRPHPVR
nr:twin-arginine translocase TatA/TatE family subunit [Tessaracoccus coleopterorum]